MLDYIWMLNPKYDFVCCKNPQVMFSKKLHKYYGYSHRGKGAFLELVICYLMKIKKRMKTLYYRNKIPI